MSAPELSLLATDGEVVLRRLDLQSLTGESCVLCDEGDEPAGCFLLAVEGLTSVSSADSSVPPSPKPLP